MGNRNIPRGGNFDSLLGGKQKNELGAESYDSYCGKQMVKRADYSGGLTVTASCCSECKGDLDKEITIETGKMKTTVYKYIATFCSYECLNAWEGKNGN
jgi:hypothetical protein